MEAFIKYLSILFLWGGGVLTNRINLIIMHADWLTDWLNKERLEHVACACMQLSQPLSHSLWPVRERERVERERQGERERERVRRGREREREREKECGEGERKRERDVEYGCFIFIFLKEWRMPWHLLVILYIVRRQYYSCYKTPLPKNIVFCKFQLRASTLILFAAVIVDIL